MAKHPPARRPLRLCGLSCWRRPTTGGGARPNDSSPVIEQYAQIVLQRFYGRRKTCRRSKPTWPSYWAATARSCGPHGKWGIGKCPSLAINLGKLGFLANMTPAELPDVLRDFAAGKLCVFEHLMFECPVLRGGKVRAGNSG